MKMRLVVAALSLSAAGFVGILTHEGYRSNAYQPVSGDVATIGFGTTSGVQPSDTITPEKAVTLALADVERFETAVRGCVSVPLQQHEFDAFVSLTYNIGGSAFCGSTLVKKLNAGDYAGACEQIKRWVYFKGQRLDGLIKRRNIEYQQCMGN
ncbi:lysozyme [uncultured Amphritea sp.]|uniref:lysozyme n=1 Tax=uncultured Amphritea sp. TaxID=981605 RepID=UPI0026278220|nr:lysozyme [uncultured Amphritea sp.]